MLQNLIPLGRPRIIDDRKPPLGQLALHIHNLHTPRTLLLTRYDDRILWILPIDLHQLLPIVLLAPAIEEITIALYGIL